MIKIAIAGDFVATSRIKLYADNQQYDEILGETKTMFQDYDYRIVNLESPVAPEDAQSIIKCGPSLRCNEHAISLLAYGGFNCATLANNHFYDYGDIGVETTISTLDQYHIDHVGGGRNLNEAAATLFKQINDETIAIINCCEHEFSIATPCTGGSNPLNPIKQYHAIQEARAKADYVVVITHGGIEDYEKPSPRMQETYRFFIEIGADAVVNHHQHCPSGYEIYQGKPIFYGLGNFCFDSIRIKDRPRNKGYVAGITFDGDKVYYQLYPYLQCNGEPGVKYLDEASRKVFFSEIAQLNAVISNPQNLAKTYTAYLEATSDYLRPIFTPYSKKWSDALFSKGLLPFYYPRNKWPFVLNKIECESHRERLINFIKKQIR